MDDDGHVAATGLPRRRDVRPLGQRFRRLHPVLPDTIFDDLLAAIDLADALHNKGAG